LFYLVGVDGQAQFQSFVHFMLDDAEQAWSEGILIPGEVLVDFGTAAGGVSVVAAEFFREGFA
jgi:hypothetical protein